MCVLFQVGDQLLEVCGINLRNAGKEQAALVLHHSSSTITMKVQFNPVDYHQFVSQMQHIPHTHSQHHHHQQMMTAATASMSPTAASAGASPMHGQDDPRDHHDEDDQDVSDEEEEEEDDGLHHHRHHLNELR